VGPATRGAVRGWAIVVAFLVVGCTAPMTRSQQVGAGEPEIGRRLLSERGCVGCHVVPGVAATPAYVGPPLDHWGRRSYIAGALPNNQENLVRWITSPQEVEPGTAMPDVGINEQEATNIAAYLLSLE